MNENENEMIQLDDILLQAHQNKPVATTSRAGEDEVSAILASLGIESKPKRADVVRPNAPQATAPKTVLQRSAADPQVASAKPLPPPQHTSTARIITAPVTHPVVEHETSTLELPSIKAFSEAQDRRRAAIERAAAEAALRRAAATQSRSAYAIPGYQPRPENLSVEVDDRFRQFFSTSAAEETMPVTEELPILSAKPAKSRKRKTRIKEVLNTVAQDPDERFLTGEFDVPMPRGKASKKAKDAQASDMLGQQTLFDLPQLQPPPPVDWSQLNQRSTPAAPSIRPVAQKVGEIPSQDTCNINRFESVTAAQAPIQFKEFTISMPMSDTTTGLTGELLPTYEIGAENEKISGEQDYNHLSDAPAVAGMLKNMCLTRVLRLCATGLGAVLLFYMGFSARAGSLPTLGTINFAAQPLVYLLANLILLILASVVCLPTILSGLVGLVGRPSVDTLPALGVVAALVQGIAYLVAKDAFNSQFITLVAPIALALLFFNTLGKWLHSLSVGKSFEIASAGYDHSAAFLVPSRELTKMVCTGLSEPEPLLLVSRPTELVKGFMRQSFSAHRSDIVARKLAYFMMMASVLCGVVGGVATGSWLTGVSSAAIALCLSAPLASSLVYAVPAFLLQKAAAAAGAVVPGPSAVQNLCLCNTVLLNAQDLFPASSVRFHGIKTFEKQRIDLAILYAASLLYEKCETLRETFMALIDHKKGLLYAVETPQTETGYGFSGWIEGHEVMIGNRAMMRRHNIEVPSRDYERKYTRNGARSIIYLAVGDKLFGMFLVSYAADANAQKVLDSLAGTGISVLLQADDFNVTAALVSGTYHVSSAFVKVLAQPEREMLAGQTEYLPESEGYMTHTGNCKSFVGGLQAASAAAAREKLAVVVQTAAMLFTLLVCIVLSFSLGLEALSLLAMLLYQLAWCAVTVLLPAINRN